MGTVLQDDPRLTVREVETPRQPLKVIVDRHGQLPAAARVLDGGRVLVVSADAPSVAWPKNVRAACSSPDPTAGSTWTPCWHCWHGEGVNELHVEAGAKLNGALLAAGLVDELLLYLAPSLFGDPARGMFALPVPLAQLAQRVPLHIRDIARVGDDWRVLARLTTGDGLMFTGIVQSVGRITQALPRGDGLRIAIEVGTLDAADVKQGDSIAVAGCCLTVVARMGTASASMCRRRRCAAPRD